ncbi:MAG: C-GCAxxG-C-C family protein [Candidatus Thermoplasmatota archaeon]|jgi:C_GCAxxG_C_C family probable redox protein|nr:C-GCAxxG-C-C family protein [Candidatus Thermoplasmatota archaeon]
MTSQKELLDDVYNRAYHYESRLGSCPQCVLAALKETIGVGDDTVFQASQGLTGGTSLSAQGTCGALAGGMMAISALVGRTYQEFTEGQKKRLVFKYTKKLYDRFSQEYGSPLCCDVQKKIFGRSYVLLDKQQYEAFEKAGAHVDKCTSVAGNAARWTAEIILKELQGKNQEG